MPPPAAPLPAPRLLRRREPEVAPVTPASIALFRLGEQCNHRCPMCTNSGRPEAWFQQTEELLRRADFLHRAGIRRVVLTGGEPTIHPGFWAVVARLNAHGMAWDINTNGSRFADGAFAARACDEGLLRAIVSLHHHDPEASQRISGMNARGHLEVLAGIGHLIDGGVTVLVNCVLTREILGKVSGFLDFVVDRWGTAPAVKLAFPSTAGKGGAWDGIQLRYDDVRTELLSARRHAESLGLSLEFESVPGCVLGDPDVRDLSRSGFGETHYLDDVTGDRLYPMRRIEANFQALAESCRTCRAFRTCPGIAEAYLRTHGPAELVPLP